eukprot:CAMPEP_0116954748 /NCGR_PEP_ID=MMETSP0467-20121206/42162_1 /TAXON_ID=283647 /ORGANISM="Mesodinium pulex, Strain SPMC105" /LENGTH=104 /DNA_ID=CAMNT_0004640569 /DNA_START=1660 /DNA_END=1974 /DNA_ORIENTATION=+
MLKLETQNVAKYKIDIQELKMENDNCSTQINDIVLTKDKLNKQVNERDSEINKLNLDLSSKMDMLKFKDIEMTKLKEKVMNLQNQVSEREKDRKLLKTNLNEKD